MMPIQFCFISTKAATSTASNEMIADISGKGTESKGVMPGNFPESTNVQPAKGRIFSMTKGTVPTKASTASTVASPRDRHSSVFFSVRIILSMFSAPGAGAAFVTRSFTLVLPPGSYHMLVVRGRPAVAVYGWTEAGVIFMIPATHHLRRQSFMHQVAKKDPGLLTRVSSSSGGNLPRRAPDAEMFGEFGAFMLR